MQNNRTTLLVAALLLGSLAQHAIAQPDTLASEIERLLADGKNDAAYALTLRHQSKETGNPAFDLAYARAALATNHPDEALFALERILATDPDHHPALLELVRAELAVGNGDGARSALEQLMASRPPEPIRQQALALAPQVDRLLSDRPMRSRFYVEAKYGYDTNINGASNLGSVDVIVAGSPTQFTNTPAQKDHFRQFDLGFETEKSLSRDVSGFATLLGSVRENFNSNEFDSDTLDARIGAQTVRGPHKLRLAGYWQQYYLDNARYRRLRLLLPDWGVRVTPAHELFLFGQFGTIDYPQQPARDVDLVLVGASWNYTADRSNHFLLSVYHGDENAGDDDAATFRKHFGRRYDGWRIRWQSILNEAQLLYLGVGNQRAKHKADEPLFGITRDDDLRIAEIGWQWQAAPAWTVKIDMNYYLNVSNVPLFEYRRALSQIGVRYTFF